MIWNLDLSVFAPNNSLVTKIKKLYRTHGTKLNFCTKSNLEYNWI